MKNALVLIIFILIFLFGCSEIPIVSDENKVEISMISESYADIFEKPDYLSRRTGQLLFNERINIIAEDKEWAEVESGGLTGYISKGDFTTDMVTGNELGYRYRIIVTGREKNIYTNHEMRIILRKALMGTVLYSNSRQSNMYEIDMPGRLKGWITNKDIIVLEDDEEIKTTSAYDLTSTANRLLGVKYIENGRSSKGIDNYGFIDLCLLLNGIPWDKDPESLKEYQSILEDYKPGDIIFISNKYNEERLELGIYIGEQEYVLASRNKGYVTKKNISGLLFSEEIIFAVRVLE